MSANIESLDTLLPQLFEAERKVRKLQDDIAASDQTKAVDALARAADAALREADEDEAALRLTLVAELLGEFEGPRVIDTLIDILNSALEEPRDAAGVALEGLAFDRFKEVATGVERAVKRLPVGAPALAELPYVFAEVPEPGVMKLLALFASHEDPDAVAAAIEVGVEIGDPAFAKILTRLLDDTRTVELADEIGEGESEVTLGELASEAIELLSGDGGGDEPPPPEPARSGKGAKKR
ncbi:MAG: hypothetical protein U0414_00390 [Polyangiaceae bacterium]